MTWQWAGGSWRLECFFFPSLTHFPSLFSPFPLFLSPPSLPVFSIPSSSGFPSLLPPYFLHSLFLSVFTLSICIMSNNSKSSSSISKPSSNKIVKIGLDGKLRCHHDAEASMNRVKKPGPRKGHKFYSCAVWKSADCGFMVWEEELKWMVTQMTAQFDDEMVCGSDEAMLIKKLRLENEKLERKVGKKKMKEEVLKEEIKSLRDGYAFAVAEQKRGNGWLSCVMCILVVLFVILMKS